MQNRERTVHSARPSSFLSLILFSACSGQLRDGLIGVPSSSGTYAAQTDCTDICNTLTPTEPRRVPVDHCHDPAVKNETVVELVSWRPYPPP